MFSVGHIPPGLIRPDVVCLSAITAAVCRVTKSKHPISHYFDAALDRRTESNHHLSSGTKWQIPPLSCLRLILLGVLSFPLPVSIFCVSLFVFQQAFFPLSFYAHGLSSLFFNPCPTIICPSVFQCAFIFLPLFSFFVIFISPISLDLPFPLFFTSCLSGPDSSVDAENGQWLTLPSQGGAA